MACFEILWNIRHFHKGKCLNNFLVFLTCSYTLSPFKKNPTLILKTNGLVIHQTTWQICYLQQNPFLDHFSKKHGKYVSFKEKNKQALIDPEIVLGFQRTYI